MAAGLCFSSGRAVLWLTLVLQWAVGTWADRPILRLHVMSKCPDAHLCEALAGDILKIFGDDVQLEVEYIDRNGFCLHGPAECIGNKEQLCVRKHYPDTLKWWHFIECQGRSYATIPGNSQTCAQEVGIDWNILRQCADGQEGEDLQRASFERSRTVGAQKSCTMFVNNRYHCTVDRRTWAPPECEHNWYSLAWKLCENNATACDRVFWD